jgi:hypothetical protein
MLLVSSYFVGVKKGGGGGGVMVREREGMVHGWVSGWGLIDVEGKRTSRCTIASFSLNPFSGSL